MPELTLRRELTYHFKVEGGNDPHSPTHYHPLIITDEPIGGYELMTENQRKGVRVLAGVEVTRRGQPRPTAGILYLSYFALVAIQSVLISWQIVFVAPHEPAGPSS